jgi:uncharacterized membrane protein
MFIILSFYHCILCPSVIKAFDNLIDEVRGHSGRDRMVVGFTTTCAIILISVLMLSVILRYTDSDYPIVIFKFFLSLI